MDVPAFAGDAAWRSMRMVLICRCPWPIDIGRRGGRGLGPSRTPLPVCHGLDHELGCDVGEVGVGGRE